MIGKNARGQVLIDGVPRLPRLLYDTPVQTAANWPAHFAARELARFHLDFYLNVQTGTQNNTCLLADALEPLGIRTLAIGNAYQQWPVNMTLDPGANPTYTYKGVTAPFRQHWNNHPRGGATYLFDESQFSDALRDDLVAKDAIYKTGMPNCPTMGIFEGAQAYLWLKWRQQPVGDWVGADCYPDGKGSELNPGSPNPPAVSSYGYMNFSVGEAVALARYHALAAGRVPVGVMQFQKFGGASRFMTPSESWSHMVATETELRGTGIRGWWATGVQEAGIHHVNGGVATFTDAQRIDFLNRLEMMTSILAELEPIMLTEPNQSYLTVSTSTGDALAQRKSLVNVFRNGGGDRPCWLWGEVSRYSDEWTRLNAPTADTKLSDHMLDQSSIVRTCAWELGNTGLASGYNLHPDPQSNVLHTWHRPITRVEVLNENRDVPVEADGRSWKLSYGGASSLRQGPEHQGHMVRVYCVPPAVVYRLTADISVPVVGAPSLGAVSLVLA